MTKRIAAGTGPIGVEVESGRAYWWCRCGRSADQPFCDGSHKGTDLAPLKFEAAEAATVWFCCCKKTGREPVCDGSHQRA